MSKMVPVVFPTELIEKVDARAKELGLNRSAYIRMVLTQDTKKDGE